MTDKTVSSKADAPLRKRKPTSKPLTKKESATKSSESKPARKGKSDKQSKAVPLKKAQKLPRDTMVPSEKTESIENKAQSSQKGKKATADKKPKKAPSKIKTSQQEAAPYNEQAAQPAPLSLATKTTSDVLTLDEPSEPLAEVSLQDVPSSLQKACANAGWAELMPVQAKALPYLLAGRDLMVQSRTGSGKTATYLLPLLERLSSKKDGVQALVLVPTRELAVQVMREASTLFAGSPFTAAAVYGGVGYAHQMEALRKGVSLVVGTPGRVLDHLLRRTLVLDTLQTLIFDEADRMLSIGFYPDMKEIAGYLTKGPRHTLLFSATYPPHVLRLAGEFLASPEMLSLSTKQMHVAEVQHRFCQCKSMDKDRVLLNLLEVENPSSCIVFCNTKATVHYVAAVLRGFGLNADELSADLSQNRREAVLRRLRLGEVKILVATDVAARGIDIPELSHVFLFEPPEDKESYIHRAGRTGRAGAVGIVISLVDIMQKLELGRIAKFYKIPLEEQDLPTEEQVNHAVSLRITALLEARLRQLTGLDKERISRLKGFVKAMTEDGEHFELLAMALDDAYQRTLYPHGSLVRKDDSEVLQQGPARPRRPRREKSYGDDRGARKQGPRQYKDAGPTGRREGARHKRRFTGSGSAGRSEGRSE